MLKYDLKCLVDDISSNIIGTTNVTFFVESTVSVITAGAKTGFSMDNNFFMFYCFFTNFTNFYAY